MLFILFKACLNTQLLGGVPSLNALQNIIANLSCPPSTQRVCFLCVPYPLQICSRERLEGLINIQWWHKMVLRVPDSFFPAIIKAPVKWPFCLLPQRLVFQYWEQMVCVFQGWITDLGAFLCNRASRCIACVRARSGLRNTPMPASNICWKKKTNFKIKSFFSLKLLSDPRGAPLLDCRDGRERQIQRGFLWSQD